MKLIWSCPTPSTSDCAEIELAVRGSRLQEISTTTECTCSKYDQVCKHLVPHKVNSNSYARFSLESKVCAPSLPFPLLPT